MSTIEFHATAELIDKIPHPFPATRAVPEWFKNMPTDAGGGPTLKRCPPYLSAMTAGYVIPMPFDVQFTCTPDGQITFQSPMKLISAHFPVQVQGAPFGNAPLLKFHNPWIVKTAPGYSTLFIQPVNRFDSPFVPLSGIVETDTYYREVHLPTIVTLRPGQAFLFRRGAPLVQVIPIKREPVTSSVTTMDMTRRTEANKPFDETPHAYKEILWQKLDYT
jgi:hypothetical protein